MAAWVLRGVTRLEGWWEMWRQVVEPSRRSHKNLLTTKWLFDKSICPLTHVFLASITKKGFAMTLRYVLPHFLARPQLLTLL
jgi:hypothetical protein